MSDGVVNIRGKQYQTVAKRVVDFRKAHPTWVIDTRIKPPAELPECLHDCVVVQARICDEDGNIVATGHAEERPGSSNINKTSALENCETSAVGRALAFLGLGGDYGIASADEVLRAVSQQNAPEPTDDSDGVVKAIEALVAETSCDSPGKALAALAKTKGALAWRDLNNHELGRLYSALSAYDIKERTDFLNTWAGK